MTSTIKFSVKGGTDPGITRPNNEDYFTDQYPNYAPEVLARKGLLYIVADGVGGNDAGEIASRMAVEHTRLFYYQDPNPNVRASLIAAIEEVNRQIYHQGLSNAAQHRMGTTITAVVLYGTQFYVANVGDSRAYLVRNGKAELLTRDHTWVAESVTAGLISPAEAAVHSQRNIITRSLGQDLTVQVDCSGPFLLQPGDRLLLCTDGLSELVSSAELAAIAVGFPPQEVVRQLIALARQRGAPDNVTALVISTVLESAARASVVRDWYRIMPWVLSALILVGVIFGGRALLQNVPPALPSPVPMVSGAPSPIPSPTLTASPTPSETAGTLELVGPADNATFQAGEPITLRWKYSAELLPSWQFQVVLTDKKDDKKNLPGEGLTREHFWVLSSNDLQAGTYKWFVLLVDEGKKEHRRSSRRQFTVQHSSTATATPTFTPTLTPSPMPTETSTPQPTETPTPQPTEGNPPDHS
ncbi:MAG TPA: protein phosphatase 2C domain-containing protein [Anaerolineae bacterium]|nr:protein phosphatase 2C domain-containing protein [Anaerolineae bacterium]